MLFDKFNSGLSNYLFQYYASGFLSLQTAVNTQILNRTGLALGDAQARPRRDLRATSVRSPCDLRATSQQPVIA